MTSSLNLLLIFLNLSPKFPALATSTLSPVAKKLVTAASIAPVPEDVNIKTSFFVLKSFFNFSVTSINIFENSGDLWCIRGLACSSSTSSEMGVGPGVIIYFFTIIKFSFPMTLKYLYQHC